MLIFCLEVIMITKEKNQSMRKHGDLKRKYILMIMLISLLPLLISYSIFIQDKIKDQQGYIQESLKQAADQVASQPAIGQILASRQDKEGTLQEYATHLVQTLQNVDIIVIADQEGRKYSHLDISQIGDIFIGEDKEPVLNLGTSYYSLKEGSQGETLRYFRPIYANNNQVGFVMVGKYQTQIIQLRSHIVKQYMLLLGSVLVATFLIATYFAFKLKQTILDMEPEEIAELYLQKDNVLNSVQEGIILLGRKGEIQEKNERAKELLNGLSEKQLLLPLKKHLLNHESLRMQEFIIGGQKLLISTRPLLRKGQYLGWVLTLMDKEEIHEVAKEIIGIEEINKHLRATVHEFKNHLHVLLGLLQLEEYEEAKAYILKIQQIKTYRMQQFAKLKDPYLRAMLTGRAIMAEEKQVKLKLEADAYVMEEHGCIAEDDLIIILGNLIENAIEACSLSEKPERIVCIQIQETENIMRIEVSDNGIPIEDKLRENIFDLGVSSKGENRGTGLYLLKKRLAVYKGSIEINETPEEKSFCISIPK